MPQTKKKRRQAKAFQQMIDCTPPALYEAELEGLHMRAPTPKHVAGKKALKAVALRKRPAR